MVTWQHHPQKNDSTGSRMRFSEVATGLPGVANIVPSPTYAGKRLFSVFFFFLLSQKSSRPWVGILGRFQGRGIVGGSAGATHRMRVRRFHCRQRISGAEDKKRRQLTAIGTVPYTTPTGPLFTNITQNIQGTCDQSWVHTIKLHRWNYVVKHYLRN